MKKCKNCGRELLDDETFFCPRCYGEIGEKTKWFAGLATGLCTAAIYIFKAFKGNKKS